MHARIVGAVLLALALACGGSGDGDGSAAGAENAEHHARQIDGLRFYLRTVFIADRGPAVALDGLVFVITEQKACPGGGEVTLDETDGTETLAFSDCVMSDGSTWTGGIQSKEEGGFVYQAMRRTDADGGVYSLDGGYTWQGDTLVTDITLAYPDLDDPGVTVTGRATGQMSRDADGTYSGFLDYRTDQEVFEDLGDFDVRCTMTGVSLEQLIAAVASEDDDPLAAVCPLPDAPAAADPEPDTSSAPDTGGSDAGPADPGPFPTEPPSVPICPATFPFVDGDSPLQTSETKRIDKGEFFPIDWYEWAVTCHYGPDPDAGVFFRAILTWQPYDVSLWDLSDFDYQWGCSHDEHVIHHGIGPFSSHTHWARINVSGASPNNETQAALRRPWIASTLDMLGAHALPCK